MSGKYRWHLFLLSATIALIFLSVFSFWSKVTFFSKSFPHVDKSVSKLTLRRTVSLEIFCISENIVAFMVCRGQCFQQVLLFPLNSCMWIVCRTMARNNLNLWILIAIFNEELGWKKNKKTTLSDVLGCPSYFIYPSSCTEQSVAVMPKEKGLNYVFINEMNGRNFLLLISKDQNPRAVRL